MLHVGLPSMSSNQAVIPKTIGLGGSTSRQPNNQLRENGGGSINGEASSRGVFIAHRRKKTKESK